MKNPVTLKYLLYQDAIDMIDTIVGCTSDIYYKNLYKI